VTPPRPAEGAGIVAWLDGSVLEAGLPTQIDPPQVDEDTVIALDRVSVIRGGNHLLRGLSWQVELDERWVILGPNGAGKTTLLNLASARMHPSRGTAHVLGERLGRTDLGELRTRIGFTSAKLADNIPAEERVVDVVVTAAWSVVGRWRESYDPMDVARAKALLGQLGMGTMTDREFGTLSEGERKRVQIARALMTDPELMLLDEPAAGLDLGGREDLVARLAELAEDPDAPAMVLVTHHVEEIPAGFTHALLLREGTVVASGLLGETLTGQNLSKTFGMPLVVHRSGDRFTARAA
jgi:iron complex transport system ATP-binding protein